MKLTRWDSESLTRSQLSDPSPGSQPHDGGGSLEPSLAIAIVSSHCLVCLGLQTILENGKTSYVVQTHQRMTPELLLAERRPDVVILDLETERDAIGTIRQIRESVPNSKILLLSGFEERQRLDEAYVCGVDGVILKVQPAAVVLATIESLYAPVQNHTHIERNGSVGDGLGTTLGQTADSETQPSAWPDALTGREREIIQLVAQGLSNKDIAYHLSISDSTVRHHLTNVFDKVGVRNRQKLLVHAHHMCSTHVSHRSNPQAQLSKH